MNLLKRITTYRIFSGFFYEFTHDCIDKHSTDINKQISVIQSYDKNIWAHIK